MFVVYGILFFPFRRSHLFSRNIITIQRQLDILHNFILNAKSTYISISAQFYIWWCSTHESFEANTCRNISHCYYYCYGCFFNSQWCGWIYLSLSKGKKSNIYMVDVGIYQTKQTKLNENETKKNEKKNCVKNGIERNIQNTDIKLSNKEKHKMMANQFHYFHVTTHAFTYFCFIVCLLSFIDKHNNSNNINRNHLLLLLFDVLILCSSLS